MSEQLPVFATNRADTHQTVAAEVNKLFALTRKYSNPAPDISIATAYINPAGFTLIADELNEAPRIRLLLGAEPEPEAMQRQAQTDGDGFARRLSNALESHSAWLQVERDTTGFTRDATANAKRMVEWLRSVDPSGNARVEVRRYTSGFLHGKAYIAKHPLHNGVIAGSSNFTFAGLSRNAELNLGYPQGSHTDLVLDWFEHYWASSEPYDLAELYSRTWEPHIPWTVFLRMLKELYGSHLEEEQTAHTGLPLTAFQSDGVRRMERLIESLGGVLVADEVGLGKTFLAGEVIRKANEQERQRVLVVAPASLVESVWKPFFERHHFRQGLATAMSYEEVTNRLKNEDEKFLADVAATAMIVIDEAHNLRNPGAKRSESIDRIIVDGKHPKKVVLLTATPVNNSLLDLETLIRYFVRDDAHFASIGISSIREYIKRAQDTEPENLTPEHLFDLMDQVAVRRTRRFVKEHYPGTKVRGPGGAEILVRFPRPDAYRVDYDLRDSGIELIDRVVHALERPGDEQIFVTASDGAPDPTRLTLARYTSSGYLIGQDRPEGFQVSNAGLLRSALLKRLESSPQALHSTLDKLVGAHRTFLDALAKGYVLQGEALREFGTSESDDLEAYVQQLDEEDRDQAQAASLFDVEALRAAVESDLQLLTELRSLAQTAILDEDSKADRLVEELTRIATEARRVDPNGLSAEDRRKVLVFSTYSDTIVALHEHVTAAIAAAADASPLVDYRGRLAEPVMGAYKSTVLRGATGSVDQGGRRDVIEGFAPATAGPLKDDGTPVKEDRYDLLLTTDVLAEGVNLQQAGRIINYDLPWNPMRIVQRHGRIDRIGSRHEIVQLGLFFPTDRLDAMLHLESTLERKLAQADAAVGTGGVLPGRKRTDPLDFTDPDHAVAEIERLLEQGGSSAALSGEEYRRRLFNALKEHKDVGRAVNALPFGSGSGFEHPRLTTNGFVFCVRIGDEQKPWFRWVECHADWTPTGRTSDDTLASLTAADPGGASTERWLTDEVYDRAFDAWGIARDQVFSTWDGMTDAAKLAPELPKVSTDARTLVQRKGQFLADRRALADRLRSVPSAKVRTALRAALRVEGTDEDRIRAIVEVIDAAGLQAPPPIVPLPRVAQDQVRLVCWMAVRGTAAH